MWMRQVLPARTRRQAGAPCQACGSVACRTQSPTMCRHTRQARGNETPPTRSATKTSTSTSRKTKGSK